MAYATNFACPTPLFPEELPPCSFLSRMSDSPGFSGIESSGRLTDDEIRSADIEWRKPRRRVVLGYKPGVPRPEVGHRKQFLNPNPLKKRKVSRIPSNPTP